MENTYTYQAFPFGFTESRLLAKKGGPDKIEASIEKSEESTQDAIEAQIKKSLDKGKDRVAGDLEKERDAFNTFAKEMSDLRSKVDAAIVAGDEDAQLAACEEGTDACCYKFREIGDKIVDGSLEGAFIDEAAYTALISKHLNYFVESTPESRFTVLGKDEFKKESKELKETFDAENNIVRRDQKELIRKNKGEKDPAVRIKNRQDFQNDVKETIGDNIAMAITLEGSDPRLIKMHLDQADQLIKKYIIDADVGSRAPEKEDKKDDKKEKDPKKPGEDAKDGDPKKPGDAEAADESGEAEKTFIKEVLAILKQILDELRGVKKGRYEAPPLGEEDEILAGKKKDLAKLEVEYDLLSDKDKASEKGKELKDKIEDLKKEITYIENLKKSRPGKAEAVVSSINSAAAGSFVVRRVGNRFIFYPSAAAAAAAGPGGAAAAASAGGALGVAYVNAPTTGQVQQYMRQAGVGAYAGAVSSAGGYPAISAAGAAAIVDGVAPSRIGGVVNNFYVDNRGGVIGAGNRSQIDNRNANSDSLNLNASQNDNSIKAERSQVDARGATRQSFSGMPAGVPSKSPDPKKPSSAPKSSPDPKKPSSAPTGVPKKPGSAPTGTPKKTA